MERHDIPNQIHYDGTGPEGATLEFIAMVQRRGTRRGGWFRETQLVCFDATRITPMPF